MTSQPVRWLVGSIRYQHLPLVPGSKGITDKKTVPYDEQNIFKFIRVPVLCNFDGLRRIIRWGWRLTSQILFVFQCQFKQSTDSFRCSTKPGGYAGEFYSQVKLECGKLG